MSLPHKSVATIKSPEFVNLQPNDINPGISNCDIKVLYLNQNRNGSYITKEVATEMAKTLRGCPIVGYYRQEKDDFTDHGEEIVINDQGVSFSCKTFPYGFVAPDANIWFQDFDDEDEFGNSITRTYLMTSGYLWTSIYPQTQSVIKQGKPQSMELEEKTLKGHWAEDYNKNIQFFIIDDAVFSKLCILGDDVQPCFEGASITAPNTSSSFSLDNNFKQTLFSMMEELKEIVKGGIPTVEDQNITIEQPESSFTLEEEKEVSSEMDNSNLNNFVENENSIEDVSTTFEKQDKEEEKEEEVEDKKEEESTDEKEDKQDKEEKYSLLEKEYNQLKEKYSLLEQENEKLKQFKFKIEEAEKDNLIKEFYMLSDEDKKDVIENKANYTLDEIKSKLAIICFEKKVNFNLSNSAIQENNHKELVTFNIEHEDNTPDWVKAVEAYQNKKY